MIWLDRPERLPEAAEAWARAAAPAANAEGFVTAPGMFSPEHADPGSRRLAEALDGRLAGRVADLGAGWGWLARAALERNPGIAELDLHEAELLALDAARDERRRPAGALPLERRGAARRRRRALRRGDHEPAVPPGAGRRARPRRAFIAAAARMLKPHGRLTLVANRQLPYEAALDAGFRRWAKLGEAGGYKLLEAEGPRRG